MSSRFARTVSLSTIKFNCTRKRRQRSIEKANRRFFKWFQSRFGDGFQIAKKRFSWGQKKTKNILQLTTRRHLCIVDFTHVFFVMLDILSFLVHRYFFWIFLSSARSFQTIEDTHQKPPTSTNWMLLIQMENGFESPGSNSLL